MNMDEKTIIRYFDIIIKELEDVSSFSVKNILIENKHVKANSQKEREYLFELSSKIKTFGISRGYFLKNGDNGWMKLSNKGIELRDYGKGYLKFIRSKKKKPDYAKWITLLIAGLSLAWNVYQGLINNQLKEDNRELNDEIEALQKEKAGLHKLLNKK